MIGIVGDAVKSLVDREYLKDIGELEVEIGGAMAIVNDPESSRDEKWGELKRFFYLGESYGASHVLSSLCDKLDTGDLESFINR